ncbi:ABC transporter ATP-binding protein [Paenibacillus sp. FSL H8-0034]|uniref:ABC transporter ATP-binding protein n=1 Tax=Paenibacillus sp. FSL H8-0034 TaxID=2954671 RepID=UPI0030F99BCC
MSNQLLEVSNLKKYFPIQAGLIRRTIGHVKAIDDVSFQLGYGETLGIVGESGCGKSTLGRMIMRILEPTEGSIVFDQQDITRMHGSTLRRTRRNFQMVFQDPYASLNPKMMVADIIAEPLLVNGIMNRSEASVKVHQLLDLVGLREKDLRKYPHEFSGGQRQRIGIARALSLSPKLIVADEAVSALDVSIQAQILNLMVDLKKEFNLSYIFISHNLSVVKHISNRVGVMYLGHLVEIGGKDSLYQEPLHPYTKALLSSSPVTKRGAKREKIILQGEVPSPANPPQGCPFHTRCPQMMDVCRTVRPQLEEIKPGHYTACHLYETAGVQI